jgi:putative DNA primase/helicase
MVVDTDDRPYIELQGGDLHLQADLAWEALTEGDDPQHPEVLLRGDTLVRVWQDGERARLEPHSQPSLRDQLSRRARFVRNGQRVNPTQELAQVLLSRPPSKMPNARRVDRVVDVPVFGADESLLLAGGYHEGARTYYLPDPEVGKLSTLSTDLGTRHADLASAVGVITDDLLGDFPFRDDASRAHAVAMLLEPFARALIGQHDPTPMYAVIAPTEGSGKTLLTRLLLLPSCGRVTPTPEPSRDGDEFRKRMTALLVGAPAYVWFDNASRALDSSVLAAALTATRWTDRILGHTRMADVPISNLWVVTGNNLQGSGEIIDRLVPIWLDAGVEKPRERRGPTTGERAGRAWRHEDILEWSRENRNLLVSAAITIIGDWLVGTQEVDLEGENRAHHLGYVPGSYERWARVMGGILKHAGVDGFLDNKPQLKDEADDARGDDAHFLQTWAESELEPLTLEALVLAVESGGELYEHLPTALRVESLADKKKALAYWLREHKGNVLGGVRLSATPKRPTRWSATKVG